MQMMLMKLWYINYNINIQSDSPGVLPSFLINFLIYLNSIFWNSERCVKCTNFTMIVTSFE